MALLAVYIGIGNGVRLQPSLMSTRDGGSGLKMYVFTELYAKVLIEFYMLYVLQRGLREGPASDRVFCKLSGMQATRVTV
jgi:hypothetical protein